jgi:hypothetical protein
MITMESLKNAPVIPVSFLSSVRSNNLRIAGKVFSEFDTEEL